MEESLLDWFNNFDFNNIYSVLIFSIFMIVVLASCIGSLYATNIEILLMGKKEILKRTSMIYIILFVAVCITNYTFILEATSVFMCMMLSALAIILYIVLYIIYKFGKLEQVFFRYKYIIGLVLILLLSPIITYVCSTTTGIKTLNCTILCALVEIAIIALLYFNQEGAVSNIIIEIYGEKWYVFRRVDTQYLLCGDKKELKNSQKTILLQLDDIVKKHRYFKRNNENQ
ncbi:MAG: hypothetical protein J6L69_10180 [Lachnospiraceae bacterium]|nr:hypothetical protein [Lachnospiraceae bacterium]